MTPDLDKYLERLVKQADGVCLMLEHDDPQDGQWVDLTETLSVATTAICAVLREQRERVDSNRCRGCGAIEGTFHLESCRFRPIRKAAGVPKNITGADHD